MKTQKFLYQIASVWLDHEPYSRQLEEIEKLRKALGVERILYDDTRGELIFARERGLLPEGLRPVKLTSEKKLRLAQQLLFYLEKERLFLLDDPRQKRSLLQVDQFLQAETTRTNHADAFWSLALATEAVMGGAGFQPMQIKGLYG